jgi:hypothetical protein
MIQVDVPLAAAMASAAAAAARTQLRSGTRADYLHAWLATNLFLTFGFGWIPIYFLIAYFGWETTHMWWTSPDVTDYPAMIPASMVLLAAFGNGGFLLGARWVRDGRDGINRLFYGGVLVACITWMVWFYPRTLKLGSATTWPTAAWCYEDPAFVAAWALTTAVWFASYGLLIAWLRRAGRHVTAHAAQPPFPRSS